VAVVVLVVASPEPELHAEAMRANASSARKYRVFMLVIQYLLIGGYGAIAP
jgi:hypothetical protein